MKRKNKYKKEERACVFQNRQHEECRNVSSVSRYLKRYVILEVSPAVTPFFVYLNSRGSCLVVKIRHFGETNENSDVFNTSFNFGSNAKMLLENKSRRFILQAT